MTSNMVDHKQIKFPSIVAGLVFTSTGDMFVVMWCGLQINQTFKFIEVFMCHKPHKLLVHGRPHKNILHACSTPSKAVV